MGNYILSDFDEEIDSDEAIDSDDCIIEASDVESSDNEVSEGKIEEIDDENDVDGHTSGEDEERELVIPPTKQDKKKRTADETSDKELAAKKKKPEEGEPKSQKKVLPSGIEVEDKTIGTGARAKNGKRLFLRYFGRLTNGKLFDSNSQGKPFSFVLGKGEVIKGWDIGLQGMQIGGIRRLTIPANLAYGKSGCPPDIPKNATLVFDVKLLDVK